MKTPDEIRDILNHHKSLLRERFKVKRLAVFGSYARGEATPRSDVDILVEFECPIGWEIVDLHDYLEAILGIRVDLTTPNALKRKPWLWESVQEDLTYV